MLPIALTALIAIPFFAIVFIDRADEPGIFIRILDGGLLLQIVGLDIYEFIRVLIDPVKKGASSSLMVKGWVLYMTYVLFSAVAQRFGIGLFKSLNNSKGRRLILHLGTWRGLLGLELLFYSHPYAENPDYNLWQMLIYGSMVYLNFKYLLYLHRQSRAEAKLKHSIVEGKEQNQAPELTQEPLARTTPPVRTSNRRINLILGLILGMGGFLLWFKSDIFLATAVLFRSARMAQLALSLGASVNPKNINAPLLILSAMAPGDASANNQSTTLQLAQLLISRGADVNANLADGSTPLIAATWRDNLPLVQFLLDHGADSNKAMLETSISPQAPNVSLIKGSTALMMAVRRNNLQIVKVLLEHGASLLVRDEAGNSPQSIAVEMKNPEMIKILQRNSPAAR